MEIKKSYSPFGSTSLSVDEVLPDIQTGRAVYPDKDKEADASYMERINQYKHEGFHNVSEDGGDSGGGDCGYSCGEGWVALTDESVTTAVVGNNPFSWGFFAYSEPITADTIKVTFNGTEYTCDKISTQGGGGYGGVGNTGPDFSEYPFAIISGTRDGKTRNTLYTESVGTYQVKIEALEETVETSECFNMARGYSCSEEFAELFSRTITTNSYGESEGYICYEELPTNIKVRFNSQIYDCQKQSNGFYGAEHDDTNGFDWSEYPFAISQATDKTLSFYTESATQTFVAIAGLKQVSKMSDCFVTAVKQTATELFEELLRPLVLFENNQQLSATFDEIATAYTNGRTVLLDPIVATAKDYYSMVSIHFNDISQQVANGGYVLFGGNTIQKFTASSNDAFPMKETPAS